MTRFHVATELLERMTRENIVIAPWLAGDDSSQRIAPEHEQLLEELSTSIVYAASEQELQIEQSSFVVTRNYAQAAFREILTSSALYLGHIQLGSLVLSEEMIVVAQRMIAKFGREHGIHGLLNMYTMIAAFENSQALEYYKQMPKDTFLSGAWHRPWINYPLNHELDYCLRNEWVREVLIDGVLMVEMTDAGRELYADVRESLVAAGYLSLRARLMRISGFTFLEDYDQIVNTIWPSFHQIRQDLVAWSEITPGMNVLELGCGTGTLTFEDGLSESVGKNGTITATDPAAGMLERAKVKGDRVNATNVKFKQTAAEMLPFEDNSFDAVIGSSFLQFTNARDVLREVQRVAKPGATFVTFYPIRVKPEESQFMLEWFAPLIQRLPANIGDEKDIFRESDDIPQMLPEYFKVIDIYHEEIFTNFSHPETSVQFTIEVGNIYERVMEDLPWQARKELLKTLVARGYEIVKKHGKSNVGYHHTCQFIKVQVRK